MVSRQDLIAELVAVGVSVGTARSRVTRATQQLIDEERIIPHKGHDKKTPNKTFYTDEDANLIRERLGVHAAKEPTENQQSQPDKTPTKAVVVTDKTPPDPKPKDTPTPSEENVTEKKGETTTKEDPLKNETAVDTSPPKDQHHPTPSTQSMKDLANAQGPEKAKTDPNKKVPDKVAPEKGKVLKINFKPNWLFYAGGLLVLLFGAWYLMKKKPKPEDEKQPEKQPEATAPASLADQYRRW